MSEEIKVSEEARECAAKLFKVYADVAPRDEKLAIGCMAETIQLLLNQKIQLACLNWRHRDAALQTKIAALEAEVGELRKTDSPTWQIVLEFAKRMEVKLAKNRHKGNREGWLKDHPWNLVERILDETVEVQQCFANTTDGGVALITTTEELADECADVANFCMMVADTALNSTKGEK